MTQPYATPTFQNPFLPEAPHTLPPVSMPSLLQPSTALVPILPTPRSSTALVPSLPPSRRTTPHATSFQTALSQFTRTGTVPHSTPIELDSRTHIMFLPQNHSLNRSDLPHSSAFRPNTPEVYALARHVDDFGQERLALLRVTLEQRTRSQRPLREIRPLNLLEETTRFRPSVSLTVETLAIQTTRRVNGHTTQITSQSFVNPNQQTPALENASARPVAEPPPLTIADGSLLPRMTLMRELDPLTSSDRESIGMRDLFNAAFGIVGTTMDFYTKFQEGRGNKLRIAPAISIMNTLSSLCADHGIGNSGVFLVNSSDLQNGAIGFINGINNTRLQSIESARQLGRYAQDAKIYGIYNATNLSGPLSRSLTGMANKAFSIGADIVECGLAHIGFHTPPVQLLKNQWNHFIATHGPEAIFFQICHSGGADHVKNALKDSPDSVRQRIIVLAINPSVVVPDELCYESHNYISKRDFVTRLDIIGNLKYGEELHILEPHPDADFWDHEFASPTFKKLIQDQITNYIENYGDIE